MTNKHLIIFETERLIVRQYDFGTDAENFFLLNSDEEVMRYIRATKSREECDAFLKKNRLKSENLNSQKSMKNQ